MLGVENRHGSMGGSAGSQEVIEVLVSLRREPQNTPARAMDANCSLNGCMSCLVIVSEDMKLADRLQELRPGTFWRHPAMPIPEC